jgi:CheY-like chemotaxis protein
MKKIRVLIVGENLMYYDELRNELSRAGGLLEIVGVSEDISEIKKTFPDIIMIDVNKDGDNGNRLAVSILNDDILSRIPVMVCSTMHTDYPAESFIMEQYKGQLNFQKPHTIPAIIGGLMSVAAEFSFSGSTVLEETGIKKSKDGGNGGDLHRDEINTKSTLN